MMTQIFRMTLKKQDVETEKCLKPNGEANLIEELEGKTISTIGNLGDFLQFGYYSIFIIVLYELLLIPQMFNMTFMVYAGFAPKVVACGNYSLAHYSKNEDACSNMYRLRNETGCEPKFEVQFKSIAYESISFQLFGVLCGALVFGQLSDLFGRKRVLLCTHAGMLVFSFMASKLSQTLIQFNLLQFASMFFVGGHNTIMHVFLLENIPKRHRIIVLTALSYSPNYVLFSGIAYLAQEWRTLLMVNSLVNIPSLLTLLFAFESPRWLIQRGMLEEARTILLRIEKINGTATDDRLKALDNLIEHEVKLNETKKQNRKYFFYHLFYTKTMCRHIFVISFALMSTSIISYALIFNMEHLSGSIFMNAAFFGLFRYSMNLSVGSLDYFVPKAGRKLVFNLALTFIVLMLGFVFLCKTMNWDTPNLLRVTTLSAAAMCSQLYMINAVVTSELFPTAVRNLATSFVQVWNRIGAIIAPHLFYLALNWAPLPFLIMLLLMSSNIFLFSVFIPETKNSSMIDHMPDKSERIFSSFSLCKMNGKSLKRMDIQPSSAKLTEDC